MTLQKESILGSVNASFLSSLLQCQGESDLKHSQLQNIQRALFHSLISTSGFGLKSLALAQPAPLPCLPSLSPSHSSLLS